MLHEANFSGLCNISVCLSPVRNFLRFRYFKFFMEHGEARCSVKIHCRGAWEPLSSGPDSAFLRFVPDVSNTPPTAVQSPTNLVEVNKRLRSEEIRIGSRERMTALRSLRDEVYVSRNLEFHWDLRNCIELRATGLIENRHEVIEEQLDGELSDKVRQFSV